MSPTLIRLSVFSCMCISSCFLSFLSSMKRISPLFLRVKNSLAVPNHERGLLHGLVDPVLARILPSTPPLPLALPRAPPLPPLDERVLLGHGEAADDVGNEKGGGPRGMVYLHAPFGRGAGDDLVGVGLGGVGWGGVRRG